MQAPRFDELTKTLAGTTTRRQALRAITVATIGGLATVGAGGTAYASNGGNGGNGGNSACAHFCAAVFGAGTPAAGQCTSDAAHGTGLCYLFGPASSGGGVAPSAICCVRTSRGLCASYPGATHCDTSQCLACDTAHGTCVSACTSGQTCTNGQCASVCLPQGAGCGPVGASSVCCSGHCGPFGGPGGLISQGCCDVSGQPCDIGHPETCCSGGCELNGSGSGYHCI